MLAKSVTEQDYPNKEYFTLSTTVNKLREEYVRARKFSDRCQIATDELTAWKTYINERKTLLKSEELAGEHWLSEKSYRLLKESFDREKHRETARMGSDRVVDMHNQYAKAYQFRIPLHQRNLSQIVHPHQGYLAAFPDRGFSWDEMFGLYETMLVSTYEKT